MTSEGFLAPIDCSMHIEVPLYRPFCLPALLGPTLRKNTTPRSKHRQTAKLRHQRASIAMSATLLFVAAVSVGWLAWRFWGTVSPAKLLLGVPLVEFDGDNSRERYAKDAGSLLDKGYDEVQFLRPPLRRCISWTL